VVSTTGLFRRGAQHPKRVGQNLNQITLFKTAIINYIQVIERE